jgi:molybdenum cofactor guanylyltransferase
MSTNTSTHRNAGMSMSRIAGVVLCGGRSSRMGADKSRLRYRGRPLSEHMGALLRQAGVEHTFLSGPDGIRDILPGRGPLGGMHACMNALAAEFNHLLFVPVDMPLLRPEQLRRLVLEEAGDAEVLQYAEQVFPLRLALSPRVRGSLMLHLTMETEKLRSIQRFIRSLPARSLPVAAPDLAAFINVNTPRDWNSLRQYPFSAGIQP